MREVRSLPLISMSFFRQKDEKNEKKMIERSFQKQELTKTIKIVIKSGYKLSKGAREGWNGYLSERLTFRNKGGKHQSC